MIGIDEVGRGCLAGPLLVVAARQLRKLPDGVTDSKVLTRRRREALSEILIDVCDFGEGWVSPAEIDRRGIAGAMRLGIRRALKQLQADYDEQIIIDGPVNYISKSFKNVQCIIDADASVPIVSAASVYAKVARDSSMVELARKYPLYGFENHVGYGTKAHIKALNELGAIKYVHRQLFRPVSLLKQELSWQQQP